MDVPAAIHVSEMWVMKRNNEIRMWTAEMEFE
jgi:hypothetical protein